jgi:hypothetical protein
MRSIALALLLVVGASAALAGENPSRTDPPNSTRICVAASDMVMRCEDLLANGAVANPTNPVIEIVGDRNGCGKKERCTVWHSDQGGGQAAEDSGQAAEAIPKPAGGEAPVATTIPMNRSR